MTNSKILWVEDDYYNYQSLFRPLQKEGIDVEFALTAHEGYEKSLKWHEYQMIVIDIILPESYTPEAAPDIVRNWKSEKYYGIGLIKWFRSKVNTVHPLILLSIIDSPIEVFGLQGLNITGAFSKRGLLPSELSRQLKTYYVKK